MAETKGDKLTTAQVSHSRVEEDAAQSLHLSQNTTSSENTVCHEKDRVSNTANDPERALVFCLQQCLKKANQGGAAISTRSSNDEHSDKISSSPAVQREETDEKDKGSWVLHKTA